jgi:hypothetical protein
VLAAFAFTMFIRRRPAQAAEQAAPIETELVSARR